MSTRQPPRLEPGSFDFEGFSDAKTVTPFSSALSPNVQEQPAGAEIDNIEVVPPHRRRVIPKTLTDPFKAGKCATFTNIGPVDFKAQQEASSSEFQINPGVITICPVDRVHRRIPTNSHWTSSILRATPVSTQEWMRRTKPIAGGTGDNDTDWTIIGPGQTIPTTVDANHPRVCPAGLWRFDPVLGHQPWWSSHANGHRVVCSTQKPVGKTFSMKR